MANDETKDYLGSGLCDYTGPGDDLPVGGVYKPEDGSEDGWGPEKMAYRWKISAPEEDAGFALVKTADLKKGDTIIGVIINPKTVAEMVATWGEDFIKIRDANLKFGFMTPAKWKEEFGTDGVGLVAIRNMRIKLEGTGVHAHPRKRTSVR